MSFILKNSSSSLLFKTWIKRRTSITPCYHRRYPYYHYYCYNNNNNNNNSNHHNHNHIFLRSLHHQNHEESTNSSNNNNIHPKHFKLSNPNESTIDDDSEPNKSKPFVKYDPRAIFPWRYSSIPLPRLIPGTEEFKTQGCYMGPPFPELHVLLRMWLWWNASNLISEGQGYFSWKREVEEGFRLAFAVAVQGVLMDVYNVQQNNHNDNDTNVDSLESPEINFNHEIQPITQEDDNNRISPAETKINNDETIITDHTRNMLECNLISLYKSAHEHMKHKLHINLKSTPKSATLMNVVAIPFLTREEVIQKPALKHCFRDIIKRGRQEELREGGSLNIIQVINLVITSFRDLANKQMKRNGDKTVQITVVAQVAIECDEIFRVVDVQTGQTIQGDENEQIQEVTHLVRFESVVNIALDNNGKSSLEIGPWTIADWDDLLDGNIWFW